MKSDQEASEERVIAIANQLMGMLAGIKMAEADTAISLMIASSLIARGGDASVWEAGLQGMCNNVRQFFDPELVEWIRHGIRIGGNELETKPN